MKVNESIQYNLKSDDILYFLHIPKTAGTTLLVILDNLLDHNKTFPETTWEAYLAKSSIDLDQYRYFRGHFGYSLHRILKQKPIYITMLRNPIHQMISWFDQRILSSINNPTNRIVTIDETFKNHEHSLTFRNPQTRWLALDIEPTTIPLINEHDERFDFTHYHEFYHTSMSDSEMLELAKKHLLECKFFGITEKFQEALFLLCYTFGFHPIQNIIDRNVSVRKTKLEEININTLNQIKHHISLDEEIYNFANDIFDNRFTDMVNKLRVKYYESKYDSLTPVEAISEMLKSNYYDRLEQTQKATCINYDFTEGMNGSGWHAREFRTDNGQAFRWTGPTNDSTIDFALNTDHDMRIRFSTILQVSPDVIDHIKLKVNSTPIQIQLIYRNANHMIFEGNVEKRILKNNTNYTRISFEVDRTLRASLTDERLIGIALDWIGISPTSQD